MDGEYRYGDAVRLLGGVDPLIRSLDTALSVGTLGLWDLIDAKNELVKVCNDLLGRWREWRSDGDWLSRTKRIEAANTILVVASFFEAVDGLDLPFSSGELKGREDGMMRFGRNRAAAIQRHMMMRLEALEIPACPSPQYPFEAIKARVGEQYRDWVRQLLAFLRGLAVSDQLRPHEWEAVSGQIRIRLPDLAVARYEDSYRRLSVDVSEFAMWANMVEHQATRAGLAELERLLSRVTSGQALPDQLEGLKRRHRCALGHSVAEGGDVPSGMQLPTLEEAYITQRFRTGEVTAGDNPSLESWWIGKEVREDLAGFLAGFLTRSAASQVPLIVLGQPGAGKSVLSKVLGARLPADFLSIRVPLREVSANAGIQEQIEEAIYNAIGEHLSWPELARSACGALPVVILDGFDELLQATGLKQSDYLAKVVRFQEQQLAMDRAVAVIVTSRTAVAHCARIPSKTVVARLEPFDEGQIGRWLRVWNQANAIYFLQNNLKPFALDLALARQDLAAQPLLLLMLAFYDADGNALRSVMSRFRQAELYERLMIRFAERELEKTYPPDRVADQVEQELQKLAFAAFSMFNRRRQWVAVEELDGDLDVLHSPSPRGSGFATPLSASERVFGRFFFVYEAQATRDADVLQTYEFLHATFGEFLIARLVASLLSEMVARPRGRLLADLNDSLLRSLLSWSTLSSRAPLVGFLQELAEMRGEKERWRDLLLELFHEIDVRSDTSSQAYLPRRAGQARRYAYYSANLALLAVISSDQVNASALLPGHEDPRTEWERYFFLWKSQCTVDEFESQIRAVAATPRKGKDNKWGLTLRLARRGTGEARDLSGQVVGSANPLTMFTQSLTGLELLAASRDEPDDEQD
ncbi:hypothetical protein [Nonomuraea sp. NPDC046570]|uniref:NACHT domain-containing protein n=1 Tax=Nonomuraea sp. NPDC046570 TaxID=3155255 RepID=UPI0033C9132E